MSNTYISHLIRNRISDFNLKKDEVDHARNKRLAHILEVSRRGVPAQKSRLHNIGIHDLSSVEPINKRQMMTDPVSYVDHQKLTDLKVSPKELSTFLHTDEPSSPWLNERVLVTKTSGTTGEPGLVFNTKSTWNIQHALMIGRIGRETFPLTNVLGFRRYRIAYVILERSWNVANQIADHSKQSARSLMDARTFSAELDFEHLRAKLLSFRPHFIMSYPNILTALSASKRAGDFDWNPDLVLSSSDLLTNDQRDIIASAFARSNVANMYSSSECQPMANSCHLGRLHQSSDCCIIEAVDENNRPVEQGSFSDHIFMTGLLNDFHPFIRYRMEDQIRFTGEQCPCGSPLPVIEIRGRRNPEIEVLLADGTKKMINSREVRMALLAGKTFDRFQVRCRLDQWTITVYPEVDSDDQLERFDKENRKSIAAAIQQLIAKHGIAPKLKIDLRFAHFDRLDPSNLKRKLFIVEE